MNKNLRMLLNKDKKDDNNTINYLKQKPLPRGKRHAIQIDKRYYMVFRKLAYLYPGTNITRWADQALAYVFKNGYLDKWLKK